MSDAGELAYAKMTGNLMPDADLPEWVNRIPDAFEPGGKCAYRSEKIYAARERIFQKLGVMDEENIEIIVAEFECIQHDLCIKMFEYGKIFAKQDK